MEIEVVSVIWSTADINRAINLVLSLQRFVKLGILALATSLSNIQMWRILANHSISSLE